MISWFKAKKENPDCIKTLEKELEETLFLVVKNDAWLKVNQAKAHYLKLKIKFLKGDFDETR